MSRRAKGEGYVGRKDGAWVAIVTVNGKRTERRAPTKQAAIARRDELLHAARHGVTPNAWTVEAWVTHWLDHIARLTPSTEKGYRSHLRTKIVPLIGHHTLHALQPEHVESMMKHLSDRGLAPSTVGGVHAVLRRALQVAMQRGHVLRNVAALVEKPRQAPPRIAALSEADTRAILAAAKDTDYPARWALALIMGLRPSEALGLTWSALDGDRLTIDRQLIRDGGLTLQELAKTDAGHRTIILPPGIVDLLADARRRQLAQMLNPEWKPWIPTGAEEPELVMFTMRDGSPLKHEHDAALWKRLLTAAGLPYTRPYTARHTAASLMLAGGSDIAVVAATLGHRDAAFTLRRYVHALEDEKAAQARRMGALLA